MKTEARTIRKTPGHLLAALLLTAALVMGMGISAAPAHAAGNNTLEGEYTSESWGGVDPASYSLTGTTQMTLYKVAGFGRDADGNSILVPDSRLNGISFEGKGWDIDKSDYPDTDEGTVEWTEEWLSTADTVDNFILSNEDLQKSISEGGLKVGTADAVAPKGTFSFSGLEVGIYLLTGESQELQGYSDSKSMYCTPRPMLVQVLHNTKVFLKPVIEERVNKLTVAKLWAVENDDPQSELEEELVRPESVDIIISFKGEERKRVTLNDDNGWKYTWDTKKNEKSPGDWSVAEAPNGKITQNYKFDITPSEVISGERTYTITNTYERKTLELTKVLENFLQNDKELVDAAFIFELSGYTKDKDGKEARTYHKYVGLSFDAAGKKSTTVKNIPRDLTRLVVREVSSPNYTVDKAEQELKPDIETGNYAVKFDNTHKDKTYHYDGGAVNKFKQNLDKKAYEKNGTDGKVKNNKR